MISRWLLALCAGPILAVGARAQNSDATRPATPPAVSDAEAAVRSPIGIEPDFFSQRRQISDEQWGRLAALMEKHSPYRWKIYRSIEDPARRFRIRAYIISQYRNVLEGAAGNREVHDLLVRRMELEDSVFELAVELGSDSLRGPENQSRRAEKNEAFRARVEQMVKLSLDERRQRIKQMEATLSAQKTRLEADEKSQRQLVRMRSNAIMSRAELFRSRMEDLPPSETFAAPSSGSPGEGSSN